MSNDAQNASPVCPQCGQERQEILLRRSRTRKYVCLDCTPPDGTCPICGAELRTPVARQCSSCTASWHRTSSELDQAPESVPEASSEEIAEPVGAAPPSDRTAKFAIIISDDQGQTHEFAGKEKAVGVRLRDAVLSGQFTGDNRAVLKRRAESERWVDLDTTVRALTCLAPLYHPVRHRFLRGLLFGLMIGVTWEALFQSVRLFGHYESLEPVILFWLPPAIFAGFVLDDWIDGCIGRFLLPGIVVAVAMGSAPSMFTSLDRVGELLAPTFGAMVVSGLIGATLGGSGGAAVAGLWAARAQKSFPVAPDARDEPANTYVIISVVLLAVFAFLLVAYVGKTHAWPLAAEISLREDLEETGHQGERKAVGAFKFVAPSGWTELTGSERFKARFDFQRGMEDGLKEYNRPGEPAARIDSFAIFQKTGQAQLIVWTLQLPDQRNFLRTIRTKEQAKLDSQTRRGGLRAGSCRLVDLGDRQAVRVDVEMPNGAKSTNLHFWSSREPGLVTTMMIGVRHAGDAETAEQAEEVLSSVSLVPPIVE